MHILKTYIYKIHIPSTYSINTVKSDKSGTLKIALIHKITTEIRKSSTVFIGIDLTMY